jgi:hypothetical protein
MIRMSKAAKWRFEWVGRNWTVMHYLAFENRTKIIIIFSTEEGIWVSNSEYRRMRTSIMRNGWRSWKWCARKGIPYRKQPICWELTHRQRGWFWRNTKTMAKFFRERKNRRLGRSLSGSKAKRMLRIAKTTNQFSGFIIFQFFPTSAWSASLRVDCNFPHDCIFPTEFSIQMVVQRFEGENIYF